MLDRMRQFVRSFQPTLDEPFLRHCGLELELQEPCDSLKGIVQYYLQITAAAAVPYPVLPDGTQAIYFSNRGAMLGGAQTLRRDIPLLEPGQYFGIWFYPASLRHFFRVDLQDISNQLVALEYLPGKGVASLHDRVYEQADFKQRALVCERWLLSHFRPASISGFEQALALIYRYAGNVPVADLAAEVGCSTRHLNRLFRQNIGLSTKNFVQVIRLQNACRRVFSAQAESAGVALDLGFYDQAHMINTFKKRLNVSPECFKRYFMSDFSNECQT